MSFTYFAQKFICMYKLESYQTICPNRTILRFRITACLDYYFHLQEADTISAPTECMVNLRVCFLFVCKQTTNIYRAFSMQFLRVYSNL